MMNQQDTARQVTVVRPAALPAWGVHLYTATGTLLAFAGVIAVFGGRFRDAFLLMIAATLVDATDGVLSRRAQVKRATPYFDGARLDDIVDYLTFVFLPALVVHQAALVPGGWGVVAPGAMLLSSAYGFSAGDAKTPDHFFTGFPSYWNIVVLYLFAGGLPPSVNAAILLVLAGLVFVRVGYVYPTRTPVLRGLTIALCLAWAVMIVAIVLQLPDVAPWLLAASLFFPVYYTVLSLVLNARRS
jgi:phosphatidylcholine synthase